MDKLLSRYTFSGSYQTLMAECFLYDDKILHVKVKLDQELTRDILDTHNEQTIRFTQGKRVLVLFDVREISVLKVPNSIMRYWAQPNEYTDQVIRFGILLQGRFMIQLANFYIRVFRPVIPTRFFESEELILDWLEAEKT